MNQFYNYEEHLKNCSVAYKTANDFDYILNNAWCTHSFPKARTKWNEIRSNVPEPFQSKISIEIGHVESGHGINQARLALKDEMEKYIDYLLQEIK